MKHLDLFSGIGGFALAADMVWPDVEHTFVEIDPYCQAVLRKHWPNSKIYGDIRTLRFDTYSDGNGRTNGKAEVNPTERREQALNDPEGRIDLLTGGFPCQPFSQAGRRKGTEDDRHLWPEMLRVIREFRPTWVVGENVAGLLSISGGLVFKQVCTDLEKEGYEVQPFVIPAVAVNAPHRRDRVWIVAFNAEYARRDGSKDREGSIARGNHNKKGTDEVQQPARPDRQGDSIANGNGKRLERRTSPKLNNKNGQARRVLNTSGYENRGNDWNENWLEVATRLCRVDDGLPKRVDRLKALGNAIVPQVAAEIFKGIKELP